MSSIAVNRTAYEMTSALLGRVAEYREKRDNLSTGTAATIANLRLQDAFESMGYRFDIRANGWRITAGDGFSSHSEGQQADHSLMLREALEAAGRHRWALNNGLSGVGLKTGDKCLDISTGLQGYAKDVRGPYVEFVSDGFTTNNPTWFLRESGIIEGDCLAMHKVCENMVSLVNWNEATPDITWSTVLAACRTENIMLYSNAESFSPTAF